MRQNFITCVWMKLHIFTLLWGAIFCNQVFELTKLTPPAAELSSGTLDITPIPVLDPDFPSDGRVIPNTLIKLQSGQELVAYHSRGNQAIKIFTKEMQLVASKDTILEETEELVGMMYSPLHHKIWTGALGSGYRLASIQVNPSNPNSLAISDWLLTSFDSLKTSTNYAIKVTSILLNPDQSYLYFTQYHDFEFQNEEMMMTEYIVEVRLYKCDVLLNACTHLVTPAGITKAQGPNKPGKAGFAGSPYYLFNSYSSNSDQLNLFDSVTGGLLATLTQPDGRFEDFVSDAQDPSHTYISTNKRPGNLNTNSLTRRIHDINLFSIPGNSITAVQDTAIENNDPLDFGEETPQLHGQYLLDFRLFRILGTTTFYSAAGSRFDGAKMFLTLISKFTFTVIKADYELGTEFTFAPFSFAQPIFANDGVYFSTMLNLSASNIFRVQTYSLKYPLCGPFDNGYLLPNASGSEKDSVADMTTNCLDSRCSDNSCKMNLQRVGDLTGVTLLSCLKLEFDLFVRNKPQEFTYALYDQLKKTEVSINSSSVTMTWSQSELCFDFSRLTPFLNETDFYQGQIKIKSAAPNTFPIRSLNLSRKFESFPITIEFRYRTPVITDASISERVKTITETTKTMTTVVQSVMLGSTVALMSTNPAAAFVISQVISTFTFLSLLNGPKMLLPEAVFTSLMSVKLIDLGLQDGFDKYAEDPQEVPISDTADRLDVRVSIIKNGGEDLVFLSIVLGFNMFLTAVTIIFLRLNKSQPTHWGRRIAEFVSKNYGLSYFCAELDSSSMELLTFVWANLFYASTAHAAARWAVVITCVVLAIYVLFAFCYWKVARGISRQVAALQHTKSGSLMDTVQVEPSSLRNFGFLWEGHRLSVSQIGVYSPLMELARATLSTSAVLSLARSGLSQLIVFGVIEVCYIGVILKWRWKEDSKEHWFLVIMELWNLTYLLAKTATWVEMTDDNRQLTWGTILSWIILSKLVVAAVYCVAVLVIEMVKIIRNYRKGEQHGPTLIQGSISAEYKKSKQETCPFPAELEKESKMQVPKVVTLDYHKIVDGSKKIPTIFESGVKSVPISTTARAPKKASLAPKLQRVAPIRRDIVD